MKPSITCLSLLLLLPLIITAQFNLSGSVSDADNGEPLAGAHILIENSYHSTISGIDGSFHFKGLKAADITIRISFIGYETYMENIKLQRNTDLQIALKPTAIMGSEVIVTGTRAASNTPATYSTVNRIELDQINLGQDMPFLLQNTPSVVTTSDAGTGIGYSSLRIRGTDLNRINVTINGIPLNDAESHGVWWVDLPDFASSVESIQIQRGVGTSTNGAAAFGASINIRTDDPETEPYGELSLAGGSFMTGKTTLRAGTGLIRNHWAFDGRFSRVISDGFIDRASADLSSFSLSGGYFGKNNIVRLLVFSGNERTYQAWDGVPGYMLDTNRTYNGLGAYFDTNGVLQYYSDQTDNYRQTHYHLNWLTKPHLRWNMSFALHYTRGLGYYEEYKTDQDFTDYQLDDPVIGSDTIASTDLIRRRFLDNHFYGLTFGFNFDNHRKIKLNIGGSANYYKGDHYGEIIWSEVAVNYNKGYRWYENDGDKAEGNLFAKITYQATDQISLYGDLQYRMINYRLKGIDNDLRDISQDHRYNFFNPKVGIYVHFDDLNKAYITVGIGNREPNRSTLIDANPAKPLPEAEILYNAEAGYKFNRGNFSASANYYFMYYRNQLVLTGKINDVGDPVMENVPQSYRTGIELEGSIRFGEQVTWNLNGTFSSNKIIDFTEYVDNWDEWPAQNVHSLGTTDIAFSPSIVAGSIFRWEPLQSLSFSLISKYVGKQYFDNTSSNERALDPYFVNDFLVLYEFKVKSLEKLGLSLKINNLFNAEYETNAWVYRYYSEGTYGMYDGYFPQAGIHFMVGAELRF